MQIEERINAAGFDWCPVVISQNDNLRVFVLQIVWEIQSGGNSFRGSLRPRKRHSLIGPCIHTHLLHPCKIWRQVIRGIDGSMVCMALPLAHHDKCPDCKEGTAIIMVGGMLVHITWQSDRYIMCRPIEGNATNNFRLSLHIEQVRDEHILFQAFFFS